MERGKAFSTYFGIFFTSLSVIMLEISLTKVFSVTLWYHFAYLVVSLALFGIGAGGLVAFFFERHLGGNLHKTLSRIGIAQFISVICCLVFILNFATKPGFSLSGISILVLTYLACSIPFVLAGLILALTLRRYSEDAPRLYAFDLVGSAIGCIVFLAAITYFSGPSVVLISGLLAAVAAASFILYRPQLIPKTGFLLLAVLLIGLLWLNKETDVFTVKYAKEYREYKGDILFEKWSPLARVTVYPYVFWVSDPYEPFGWGMSKKFEPKRLVDQLWIEQDAFAGTPITRFDGDLSAVEFLKYDITALPYHIKPKSKAFIIGAGGGRDVLTALIFQAHSILACDINPVIIGLVKERYASFAGNLYSLPQVRAEVAEARNYIRKSTERFDIVQISLTDSWAATSAGAFSLAENSLYTTEAFVDYFNHLNQDGVVAITRYLFLPRNQSLRAAIVARKALETMGIQRPEHNIAVVGTSENSGMATILVKRTALNSEEIRDIMKIAKELGFSVLYLPGHTGDEVFAAALKTRPLEGFLRQYYYDVRPTTDDRPFFFQMVYLSRVFDLISGRELTGQKFNYYAQAVVLALLVILSVLVLLFYVAPLIASRKVEAPPKICGIYFILIGLGFMFVEIPLLQKGSLYLGHPTYSLSVVLFSMLVFAGLGSYWSGKFGVSGLHRTVASILLVAGLLIGIATFLLEWVVPNTIGFPLGIRVGILLAFISVLAFLMGTAFPSGIRLIGPRYQNAIPWVWALNGGASVLGSIIAMAISMNFGYRYGLMMGVAAYLLSSLLLWYSAPGWSAAPEPSAEN